MGYINKHNRLIAVLLALLITFGAVIPLSPVVLAEVTDSNIGVEAVGALSAYTSLSVTREIVADATAGTQAELQSAVDAAVLAYGSNPTMQYVIKITSDIILADAALTITGGANIRFISGKTEDSEVVDVTITADSGYQHILIGEDSNMVSSDVNLAFGGVILVGSYDGSSLVSVGGIEAYLKYSNTCTLTNAVIQNCNKDVSDTSSAIGGGGVYTTGSLTLNNCKIEKNSTTRSGYYMQSFGNGVYSDGMLIVSGGEVSGNYCAGNEEDILNNYGGGLYANDVIEIKNGAQISGNTAGHGGGLYTYSSVEIKDDAQIIGNSADINGGGVNAGELYVYESEISGNTAGENGGGIYTDNIEIYTGALIGGYGKSNTAGFNGGGIYCGAWGASISGGEISYNTAGENGGGVWCKSISLDGGTINENDAGLNGGGIYLGCNRWSGTVLSMNNACIQYNNAGEDGGGIYAAKESFDVPTRMIAAPLEIHVFSSSIDHNTAASGNGGGIFTNMQTYISGSEVSYNKAPVGNGGGIFVANKYYYLGSYWDIDCDVVLNINNALISSNHAEYGGGIYLTKPIEGRDNIGDPTTFNVGMTAGSDSITDEVTSVYIIDNIADYEGGGIYTEDFVDYSDLTSYDYQNIITYTDVYFAGNRALAAYALPDGAADLYANIAFSATSVSDIIDNPHPINNFDINYLGNGVFISTYTVTYDGNNATSGNVPIDDYIYLLNNVVTVEGNTGNLEREGYIFSGWNIKADGSDTSYMGGNTFTITGNVTLYAQWEEEPTESTTEATTSTGETESTTSTGETESTTGIDETESTTGTDETESTTSAGETESTTGTDETESTTSAGETESTTSIGEAEVTTNIDTTEGTGTTSVPKTGDTSNIVMWVTLLCIYMAGAVCLLWTPRKRKQFR